MGGIYAGVKLGAAVSTAVSTTGVGAAVAPVIMIVSALGGAAAGGYAAYKGIDYAQRPFESNETKVQRKDAENYEQNVVKPLETKIKELEKALEAKLDEFYK